MSWAEGSSVLKLPDHVKAVSVRFVATVLKIPVEGLEFVLEGFEVFHYFCVVHGYNVVDLVNNCNNFFQLFLAQCQPSRTTTRANERPCATANETASWFGGDFFDFLIFHTYSMHQN